jgi:hypothetical protein
MARQTVPYKGYGIESLCQKIENQDHWTLELVIIRHAAGETRVRPFSAANTFPTKEQADAAAIELGKKIIDGSIPGMSVADL